MTTGRTIAVRVPLTHAPARDVQPPVQQLLADLGLWAVLAPELQA